MNHPTSPQDESDGLRHWLAGVRCPACQSLNASWLFHGRSDGPTVTCHECGDTVRVLADEGLPGGGCPDGRGAA